MDQNSIGTTQSFQPVRPPLSQQPPQRIDAIPLNKNLDTLQQNKDKLSPDNVDITVAYKRRSLKHHIHCGNLASINNNDINELSSILGKKKCSMYVADNTTSSKSTFLSRICQCVVCDDKCLEGVFAVETILFIPNKNDPAYDDLGRFRVALPRISCHECASEFKQIHNISNPNVPTSNDNILSLGQCWNKYLNGGLTPNNNTDNTSTPPVNISHEQKKNEIKHGQNIPQQNNINQHQQNQQQPQLSQQSNNIHNNQLRSAQVSAVSEADRDPFDDGFLICTQLVKTGGADQGGLQVGDVFVEFGHYSKKRFPGLKSIANLVRRSAGKEINVVVWRKLEQMNAADDDGSGRTVFQKLALKLKPLQSHDADGGGVLGAVINTYPLPEMKN